MGSMNRTMTTPRSRTEEVLTHVDYWATAKSPNVGRRKRLRQQWRHYWQTREQGMYPLGPPLPSSIAEINIYTYNNQFRN